MSDQIYYEESVIFYHWLMDSKQIKYPHNEGLWIKVCSFGLRIVLESFLLESEYQQWLRFREAAIRYFGERFVEDKSCKNLRRSTDEQVRSSCKHWGV
jgi:hypothetical protein